MASEATKTHPWHLVEPSHWPVVGSISAFLMASGGIWYMHDNVPWVLGLGTILLLVTFFGWWRDVVREGHDEKQHSSPVRTGLRVGMILFIVSEVMFFFAFFWAFFHSSLPILNLVAGPWPPKGIEVLETWHIPFLNTLILLSSGATVTWAHHALLNGERAKFINGIAATVILGVIFLGFQIHEYGSATFNLTDGIYPSTFYLATGFHGFHVFVGACFLTVCFFRARGGHFTAEHHVGFEAAAWYWHFVDVVWLFLFVNVYVWGSSGVGHIPVTG